jgi:hypothetical protein
VARDRSVLHLGLALALGAALAGWGGKDEADQAVDLKALRAQRAGAKAQAAPSAQPTSTVESAGAVAGTPLDSTAGTAKPAAASGASAPPDSLGGVRETEIVRETFTYGGGTRDPFGSLLKAKSAGPELPDLQLVGIYENLQLPSQSVAIVREKISGKRHKLRAGDQLGRLRVTAIRTKDVVFTVQDFGYERQETLSLRKPQEDGIQ